MSAHPALGLDISKQNFHAALLLANGNTRAKVLPNTLEGHAQLLEWLQHCGMERVHACMEATGSYGRALASFLSAAGHTVSVVNPLRVKGFALSELTRTKTDKVDAAVIARFCAALKPAPWQPPAEESEQLQALMRRLEALMQMLQREQNRFDGANPLVQDSLERHVEFLKTEMALTRQQIHDHFEQHPELCRQRDLLVSIPGIGEQTAGVILAEVGSIEAFDSARQLAAYAGLTPREKLSGTSVRGRAVLSKVGNARLRKALYMPAMVSLRHNPVLKDFWERLLGRGKSKPVALGALMRKLLQLAYGVLKSGKPFDPEYGRTVQPS